MRGILLIGVGAWGDGFYYNLSYNMALSIKLSNKDTQIALLTDDVNLKYLTDEQKKVFDKVIYVGQDLYMEDYKLNPFLLKTKIYDLTPFDETLYVDSDGLFVGDKSINDLFEQLSTIDFQIHEVRRYTKEQASESGMIWTKPKENEPNLFCQLWEKYNLGEAIYAEYNSSFIWFKKSDANKIYFDKVKENYFDRRLEWKAIGTNYPDEMTWNITTAQLKHYGPIQDYKPCYFEWEHGSKELEYIKSNCYFMMMAGGYQIGKLITYYDNLIKGFRNAVGDGTPFRFDMLKKIFFQK
jgi:hypothetical protein